MKVFIASDNVYSPLGSTTEENFKNMVDGKSSISLIEDSSICRNPAYLSVFKEKISVFKNMTKFENIAVLSISDALKKSNIDPEDSRILFILSTTKGNIGILDKSEKAVTDPARISLKSSADVIARHFKFVNEPLIISNACISGVVSVIVAERMIKNGLYDSIVVTGADVLSEFIVGGFQALKATGSAPCKPFDAARDGISLGECASTIVLTKDASKCSGKEKIECCNGAFNSDANHISGPSRTAEGLYLSISRTLRDFGNSVDTISAHGTATSFNDETEAIGFDRAGLNHVPLNSLKGYLGHTLGAAGVAEIAVSATSLKKGLFLRSFGYGTCGVSKNINVAEKNIKGSFRTCLKTASGFGGCNASVLMIRN